MGRINLEELAKRNIIVFLDYYNITTESGEPLDFFNHPYLVDIFLDFSPKQVWLKAAQLGLSTTAILKTFFIVAKMGLDVIYSMPAASDLDDFVGGKLNRIVNMNERLSKLIGGTDNIKRKQIENGVVYFRGTMTERAAISVSADLYVCDEMDRSDLKVVEQYKSRLNHSKFEWEWYFSNPKIMNAGVHKKWQISTQNHWFVKCSHCGKWQYMSFPDSFHEADPSDKLDFDRYICKHCGKTISSNEIRNGKWIKKHKEAKFSGYWMPLWINPLKSAKDILEDYRNKPSDYFANFVCGLPAKDEGGEISENLIYQNCNNIKQEREGRVIIGCDSGITKHYTVGDSNGIFEYGKTTRMSDVENFLLKYPNSLLVMDAMPDITAPRELANKYPSRVFLCFYTGTSNNTELIKWNSKDHRVNADRSGLFQILVDELNAGSIIFENVAEYWSDYVKHFNSTYRITEKNNRGMDVIKWECADGIDHWLHSLIYWRIGMDKNTAQAKILTNKRKVRTSPTIKQSLLNRIK